MIVCVCAFVLYAPECERSKKKKALGLVLLSTLNLRAVFYPFNSCIAATVPFEQNPNSLKATQQQLTSISAQSGESAVCLCELSRKLGLSSHSGSIGELKLQPATPVERRSTTDHTNINTSATNFFSLYVDLFSPPPLHKNTDTYSRISIHKVWGQFFIRHRLAHWPLILFGLWFCWLYIKLGQINYYCVIKRIIIFCSIVVIL